MKSRLFTFLSLALTAATAIIATGCHDDNGKNKPEPLPGLRTVLVYQVANNNLGSSQYDRADIVEMINGAKNGDIPEDSHLLVYNAGYNTDPTLVEVTSTGLDTIKTYSRGILSVRSERMLEVLDDAETFADTKEFGLVLWSHGSGWLQDGIDDSADVSTKSFGSDNGSTMNITTLAKVLEQGPELSFLYFDCCYMASVETLYELRHAAPVIVGSATELRTEGMPYHENLSAFFSPVPDMVKAATNTFELYNQCSGMDRTCTMSVIRTSALDSLARATKAIFTSANGNMPASYTPQRFMNRGISNCMYFDFAQYVEALCMDTDGSERFPGASALLDDFHEAMSRCVIYAAATPMLWNTVPLDYHCGLSTYILSDPVYSRNIKYYTLSWYNDVASNLNFK